MRKTPSRDDVSYLKRREDSPGDSSVNRCQDAELARMVIQRAASEEERARMTRGEAGRVQATPFSECPLLFLRRWRVVVKVTRSKNRA